MANPNTRASRRHACGCFLPLILFLIAVLVLVLDEVAPVLWVKGNVAVSAPGVGATRGEVESWFDRQGIHHTRCSSVSDSGGYPAGEAPSEFGGLAPGVQGTYIVGNITVPHVYGWFSEVWLYFFFDSDGRLIQNVVKRWERYP